jgi:hypothetical protein
MTTPRIPGLDTRQEKALARLEKKTTRLTDFEVGMLRAFRFFGDEAQSRRAQKLLTEYQEASNA